MALEYLEERLFHLIEVVTNIKKDEPLKMLQISNLAKEKNKKKTKQKKKRVKIVTTYFTHFCFITPIEFFAA